jgi:dihydroorotate dehydrogenase electron transfer subunit
MPTIYQQKAEILRAEKLTDDIFRFSMKAPDIAAAAIPGQFVMVRAGDGMDPLLRRPFSIHQVAGGGLVQILFKVIGKGTRMLSKLQTGEFLDVLGPLGQGFSHSERHQHYLVGGGIGIAPLLYLARQLLKKNEPSSIKVFLGAGTGDEIGVLAEDFNSMGLQVQCTTEDGSLGTKGLVTDILPALNGDQVEVYGCGPYPMLRAVVKACNEKSWNCQVSLETIMACGLAACLGCTVLRADMKGYVHVCKDGPVFEADKVAWL